MQDCTVLVSRFGCIAPQNLKQVSLFGLEHLDVENCGAHVIVLAAYPLPVVCFGGRTYLYWNSTNAVVFRVLRALWIAPFRMKLFCLSLSQKQLESPRLTLCVGFRGFVRIKGSLQSNPDLSLQPSFLRPKNLSKTCAP